METEGKYEEGSKKVERERRREGRGTGIVEGQEYVGSQGRRH